MADLILNSLEIENFRAFRHLRIERLGRVNLVTGRNNVGKTSLLEALWLYARGAMPPLLLEMLHERNEMHYPDRAGTSLRLSTTEEPVLASLRHLFHGREKLDTAMERTARIGAINGEPKPLTLTVRPTTLNADQLWTGAFPNFPLYDPEIEKFTNQRVPYLIAEEQGRMLYRVPVMRLATNEFPSYFMANDIMDAWFNISKFIKADGLDNNYLSLIWDRIALTDDEQTIICALRLLHPGVERVSFINEINNPQGRTPIVKLAGQAEPIPLRSLGDGINRLFGLTLALVDSQGGFLLVDEVENGLHYSVLHEVWQTIFALAERLNVQVFATTHNWECIESFSKAAQESEAEGHLIRLVRKKEGILAAEFDESDLEVVTREYIEVR